MHNTIESCPDLRLRRLRQTRALRALVRETELNASDLIMPIFVHHERTRKKPVASMPGICQLGLEHLAEEVDAIVSLRIPGIILFGIPSYKDPDGNAALEETAPVVQATRYIKTRHPELLVIADLCLCEYTSHGHCGLITHRRERIDVDNDPTLSALVHQAIVYAEAGVDIIAPSGMMDGIVGALRKGLDNAGHSHIPILSYAVKYASSLYGPFREATEGVPQFGDRKTYQQDPANGREALREAALDVQEGADMLMVKPAAHFMDIIYRVKQTYPEVPLGAYHVSGEYAMIKAAAASGWIKEKDVVLEVLTGIKRAGADFIISYHSKDAAAWQREV